MTNWLIATLPQLTTRIDFRSHHIKQCPSKLPVNLIPKVQKAGASLLQTQQNLLGCNILKADSEIFPKHRCCWDERSKEVRLHSTPSFEASLPPSCCCPSSISQVENTHQRSLFHDTLTAQQCLKSPGCSRDSSFQQPLTKLCLGLQWALPLSQALTECCSMGCTPQDGRIHSAICIRRGRINHYFLGMLLKRQYPHLSLLAR